MRYSPEVRITRSGSGMSGRRGGGAIAFSSILSAGDAFGDERPHGVDDLGPTAVVEGDGERHRRVVAGQLDRLVDALEQPLGHPPVARGR